MRTSGGTRVVAVALGVVIAGIACGTESGLSVGVEPRPELLLDDAPGECMFGGNIDYAENTPGFATPVGAAREHANESNALREAWRGKGVSLVEELETSKTVAVYRAFDLGRGWLVVEKTRLGGKLMSDGHCENQPPEE